VQSAGNSKWKDHTVCLFGVYLQKKMLRESEDFSVTAEVASARLDATDQSRSAQRDLLELAVGYTLILATVWTANPTQRILYWLAFAWIVATTWLRRDGWTALGLGRKGLLQSLWIVGAALLFCALALVVAWQTHRLHRLHGRTPLLLHGWGYIVWSLMQQFLLQSYFLLRLLRLLPGRVAPILVAAGIFSLAHLPNPVLTPITFVWGVIACVLFLRYRNIYTLGVAHGILGLCVAVTVPNSVHRHMRVGLGYLRYHPRAQYHPPVSYREPPDHRSQSDQRVSTDAWVIADAPTRRS
jgi:membrane protease YdiL (CAAX protease family)